MRKLTYEAVVNNPELLRELEQNARRERVAAIGELLARLFKASKVPTRHAPRPHLAH